MAESFSVQRPVKIPKATEYHKIGYQEQYKQKKEQQEDSQKSPFQKLMEKEETNPKGLKITPEQIFERMIPHCKIYIIDYDSIMGLYQKNYPLNLFFQDETTESDLKNPQYLKPEETNTDSLYWQEMLAGCRGNVILIHPQQWQKMKNDLEYAVMLVTEVRSVLAKKCVEAGAKSKHICVSCVAGIDETGLSVCLFFTDEKYKHRGITSEKLMKLRIDQKKKSDRERKQEFMEKLRHQKRELEKYRYDTAVMNRVRMTAKLFDAGAVRGTEENQVKKEFSPIDEISLSLIELITGGL